MGDTDGLRLGETHLPRASNGAIIVRIHLSVLREIGLYSLPLARAAASLSLSFLLFRRPLIPPFPGGATGVLVGSKPSISSFVKLRSCRFSIKEK